MGSEIHQMSDSQVNAFARVRAYWGMCKNKSLQRLNTCEPLERRTVLYAVYRLLPRLEQVWGFVLNRTPEFCDEKGSEMRKTSLGGNSGSEGLGKGGSSVGFISL